MKTLQSILLMVLSTLAGALPADESLPKGILAVDGRAAPQLRLEDMDGGAYDLSDNQGQWAFVHFWASWCGPCRKEMPAVQRMAQRMEQTSLQVVLINTAEDDDTVFSFMSIVAPEMVSLMDRNGLVTEDWQPRGLPATYLVDPDGQIRFQALGGRPWDEEPYLSFLRRIIGEPKLPAATE